ncbi:MAG TPA: DCC1-like thiol-disulfide oxidoreductase family protein [Verrucomicrobiae bacterium]|nr:DCC1-like thiol-disulfide oxidoreductase family protein [Verrucomicrobiae bacterium]
MRTIALDVKKAPARPILVYDADCNFCRYWARRWREDAANRGECISLQDGELGKRFPEVPRKEWEQAIHLIDTNGTVYAGAEAVFRFRARNRHHRTLYKLYARSRVFAAISEVIYRFVSHNRPFFSWIWGTHP